MPCAKCHAVTYQHEPKILFFDIETTPFVSYTWGLWETDVVKVIDNSYILCVAYKWKGGRMKFIRTNGNDKKLCEELHELFSEADIIVAHNGDKFDIKKTNARLIYWGMTPPEQYKTIDTLKLAKKHFSFPRNKLDSLGEFFDLGRKVKHEGIDLWDLCMKGDAVAWKRMERYNRQDVVLLEKVYNKLLPWMKPLIIKHIK